MSALRFAALAALAVSFLVQPLAAQEGLENLVGTVGTTIQDGTGRQWAYLFWQGSSPGLVLGRTYAIYAKPGDPSSPAPFQRVSIVSQQSDTRNIEPLLRRSENVGQNPAKLEQDLHSVFESLMPAGSISRAEKLSAAIRGSLADEEHFQNLLLMARLHPGVAMALGVAFADVILPGLTTYEIRQFDPAQEQDVAVVGRVTLQPGVPTELPAPGAPVEFVDSSARGDVNVKMRWATPDPLRRLGLLHYGFNVWRVTRAYAEAPTNNWHVTPPASVLLAVRTLQNPGHVKRCNNLPILTDKDFSFADVANFNPPPAGDPETFFYSDDDSRFRPDYVNLGFTNGARFYYFVSARDILGRDGLVSPGALLTVCDRMPPLPPDTLKVLNDYAFAGGTPQQFLRVTWNQSTNVADPITNYWVYRWTNIAQIQANAGNPSNNLIAIVRHTNNVATASYLDNGPGAPSVGSDLGRTYWYTVRAQDLGACGPNLSGNSAPAFGVLRDREGPPAPTGFIDVYCVEPNITLVDTNLVQRQGKTGLFSLRLEGLRTSEKIAWVGFLVQIYDPQVGVVGTLNSGFLFYSPGEQTRTYSFELGSTNTGRFLLIHPFTGTVDGKITPVPTAIPFYLMEGFLHDLYVMKFEAGLKGQRTRLSDICRQHTPVTPDGSKTNIIVTGTPSPGSKEWRIYRRVDDGPMTLLCHGAVGGPTFTCQDDGAPPNGANICYYLQVLDEHGNPSPMVKLGCVDTAPHAPPPAPLLSPLLATGVTNNPGMTMTWFAPPPGIERFQVWIAGKPLGVKSNLAPGFLALQLPNPVPQTLVLNGETNTYDFYLFQTPRIGPGFGPGPQFAVPTGIELGNTYTVFIKAVANDGTVGEMSNIEQFVWNPANTNFTLCTIPWPARGLPAINTNFAAGLAATYVQSTRANFTGAVVSVGTTIFTSGGAAQVSERPQWLNGNVNPMSLLFTNPAGDNIFPLALYRFQVTNAPFPRVSGDIVQVSPLMENISYQITNYSIVFGSTVVHVTNSILRDSYIVYDFFPVTDNLNFFFMYLLDTQPVISGARYRYLLVRFRKNGEIAEVLPTNEMEVP
jgi:hypothetical protein